MKRAAAAALAVALSACFPDPPPEDQTALAVSISGLPAGTDAGIVITGASDFNRSIIAAQTFTGIAPGTYTVSASGVVNGSAVFTPLVASQSVEVTLGARATAAVAYAQSGPLKLQLQQVTNVIVEPLFLIAPDGDDRLFVLERAGRIRLIKSGIVVSAPVLDISARVSTDGERGLLSLAFDPQFAVNGSLYVYFTDRNGDVQLERYQVPPATPDVADPASRLSILTIPHSSFNNNNGGRLAFGADGFLYISVGDGGGGGDPLNNGQNLNSLLGKLLRIDVTDSSPTQKYAIPADNPFAGQSGRRQEIWAYGLRNPWRYDFDPDRELVYIADVGQGQREEINVVPSTAAGLNYGWNIMEGSLCFSGQSCPTQGLTVPVLEYSHGALGGACSIIGGFVYRGSAIPELTGRFFYSDYCNGFLRSFRFAGGVAAEQIDWNIQSIGQVTSFGEDAAGEMYILTTGNIIYRIVRQ